MNMTMSKHPNSGGENQHAEQEIIKTTTTSQTAQATANYANENGAPAAEKVQDEKKIEPNSMAASVTREERKLKKLLNPVDEDHHIGFLQSHLTDMTIVPPVGDQGGNSRLNIHFGSPSRRCKIAHSDPVRWKIKSQQGTLNKQQLHLHESQTEAPAITVEQQPQALQAPPILWISQVHRQLTHARGGISSASSVQLGVNTIAIHHVVLALTAAPAPAIIDRVVTVSSSSTDQLQNSRPAAAPVQLDPVVFEPGFLPWDQVNMPDEAYTRSTGIHLYPSIDIVEEIN